MKIVLRLFFPAAFLLATFNFGQTPTQTAAPAKASLAGTVVRAGSGQALKNVQVSLRRANAGSAPALLRGGVDPQLAAVINNAAANIATVMTDEMGRFLFTGMDAGSYFVSAERDSYVPWE